MPYSLKLCKLQSEALQIQEAHEKKINSELCQQTHLQFSMLAFLLYETKFSFYSISLGTLNHSVMMETEIPSKRSTWTPNYLVQSRGFEMIPSQIPQYLLVVFVLRFLPGAHWSLEHAGFTCFTVSLRLVQPLCLYKNWPTHAACQALLVQYQPEIR